VILSVSRRTDIPAFYTDWFFTRLREGYLYVRNPMSYHQVSRVSLTPTLVDFIVFWTKNPSHILTRLDELSDYHYYFQITINAYGDKIERNVPERTQAIRSFQKLATTIGKSRTIWRYDPIILTDTIDLTLHVETFQQLADSLSEYTNRCVISFLDFYKKTERNIKSVCAHPITDHTMLLLSEKLSNIARRYNMVLETCSEMVDLSGAGIEHAKCIDERLISEIVGKNIVIGKDKNQRETCGCAVSIDIGAYNTCRHGCLYCYANFSDTAVKSSMDRHKPDSPFLIGDLESDDKITERKMESHLTGQLQLF